jgi:hypothetical protein
MFHVTKLYSCVSVGGRLVSIPIIVKVGAHALFLQVSAPTPVMPAPAAGKGKKVKKEPNDNDSPEVGEWIVYRSAKQATYGNEKGDRK